jgi:aquaporin Z
VSTGVPRSVSRVLVSGLVSTILGAASNDQNLGPLSAVGVGAYIALAGLWASPVSGASMNPARSLGPVLASGDLHQLWIYLTAPKVGMLIAVAAAHILRGPGGGPHGTRAAKGNLGRSTGGSRAGAAECRCRPCRFSVIGRVPGQHRRWRSYAHTE